MATGREMEAREPASVTLIPDPVCGGGLKSTWGLGKQLFLFAGTQPFHQEKRKGTLNGSTFIHHLKWDTEMHGPVTRKLANETRNVFKFLQTKVAEASGSSLKSHLVKASHLYRAVLKACSIDLHEAAGNTVNDEERETLERQVQIYETIDLIWSLCEILFIDVCPGGVILTRLLEWLRWHFCEVESQAVEVVQTDPPDSHPDYWDTIYRFILQGRLDKARELLAQHPHRHLQGFISMDELLRKMPLQATFNDNSLAVFDMKWRHWREEVIRRLETGEFSASNNLEKICRILMGDDAVFSELKDLCETWYHMLVSKMLYQNPTVQGSDLQYSAQSCMNEYGTGERRAELDNILMAALEYDIHQVINICSAVVGNWWFVVHLSDLFHHAGVLEAQQLPFGSNLREFLMLEYAAGLMSHKSLWEVGMDYLDYCPEYGRQYQELYLEHIPLDTEMKASKVLNACKARDMQELAKGICRSMGMAEIRNGRLGSALTWAMRSKDVAFATMIAEKYLTEYTDKGDFPDLGLLDSLGPSMLLSKRLTFLGKYREFHKMYGDGEMLAASELLLSLLTSKLAPRQFVMNLLIDALPLLECGEVVFTSEQTYELMHCLETLTTFRALEGKPGLRQGAGEQIHRSWTDFEKDKVELIRLGLARNLARAILKEGSVTF